ncbi:MAG: leucine-rich repeat domain-containing protein, partial [Lachnospiraceae bacterium]
MKNKLGKKLLALILSMSLLFIVVPSTPVFAAGEVYGILTNSGVVYNCDSDGKNPGSTQIAMEDVTNLFIADNVEIIPSKSDSKKYLELVSITIPPNVRVIEELFWASPKLENIDFSNATGLEEIKGKAFVGCASLKTVDLSKAINLRKMEENNRNIGLTFGECTNLEKVILPKNLEKLSEGAFTSCYKLVDVTFLSRIPPSIGGSAFYLTKDQIRLHLPAGSNANEWEAAFSKSGASNPVFSADNKYGIYKGGENVYECDENAVPTTAIADKRALTHLFIAEDVTAIKNNAFSECGNIIEVNFSNAANLTSIGDYAFSDCGNIETMVIPNTVTSIGEFAFANCKNLNSVTLPKDITQIRNSMFAECNKLERIEIPQNVTEINDFAFRNCQSLSSVSFQSALPPTFGTSSFENTKDGINVFLNDTANENDWREKLITAGMTNPNFAKDTTPPTAEITVGDAIFTTATDPVTFDTLLKDKAEITITASDETSAISKIEYQNVSSEDDYNVDGTWEIYTDKFDVNYLGKNIIYARATDLAGNQTIINT